MLGSISKIFNIIVGVIIAVLIVLVITFGCLYGHTYHKLITVQTEANHLSQTVKQLRMEEEQRLEILRQKDELLNELKQAKNWREICDIWQQL